MAVGEGVVVADAGEVLFDGGVVGCVGVFVGAV